MNVVKVQVLPAARYSKNYGNPRPRIAYIIHDLLPRANGYTTLSIHLALALLLALFFLALNLAATIDRKLRRIKILDIFIDF